jgi:hypothetical protein
VTSYHVTLDSQGYLLDLKSYRKSLVEIGTEGTYSQLAPWQQDDWRRGIGYGTWEPGVLAEAPNVDVSRGDLRVGPALTTVYSPASVTDLWALIVYGSSLYALRGDGADIYASSDGTTWSNPHDTSYAGHRGACRYNGWLMIGSSDSGEITQFDGTTWTDSWVTLTGTKTAALAAWHESFWPTPYLFAGVNQSSGGARLYRVSSSGTSEIIGTVLESEICALMVYGGLLWVATIDEPTTGQVSGALYTFNGELPGRDMSPTLRRVAELADNAVTSFVEFRGELWAGSRRRGKLWTVSPTGLREQYTLPQAAGIGGSFDYGFAMRSLLVHDDRLIVPVVHTSGFGVFVGQPLGPAPGVVSPAPAGATTPDPIRTPPRPLGATGDAGAGAVAGVPALGWSTPSIGAAGQEPRGIASFKGQLYLSNKRAAGAAIIRIDTTATTSAELVTASFDAGLPAVDKLLNRVRIQHLPLAAQESVFVEYQLEDTGAWTTLGYSETDGATAANFGGLNVTFRRLRLRLTLALVTTSATPAVTAIAVEYRLRPVAKEAWEFDCRLEGTAALPLITLDGTADPKTGAQLADALWVTAEKTTAVTLVDLDGESKTVEVVGLEERVAELSQRHGVGTRGRIRLQQV